MSNFVTPKEACKQLGVVNQTLYRYEKVGMIETTRTPGGKRLYNIEKFLKTNVNNKTSNAKRKICYCRVSSRHQMEDLKRQVKYMKNKYPEHEIIADIGSGLNFNRKGLREIMRSGMNDEIKELVVAYKDRLCRFGYDLIEWIIKERSNGRILVENNKEKTPEEEITQDIIQIMNVYTAKINGLRKYKNKMLREVEKEREM